jgi:RecA-family ATPase
MEQIELSEEQIIAYDKYIKGHNIFITGPGGTGKSMLIKEIKKRVESNHWNLSREYFNYDTQLRLIRSLFKQKNSSITKEEEEAAKIIIQQIQKKITGYKQQDILKKKLDEFEFITFDHVFKKMVDSELKCYYCKKEMLILYDISRETTQWTVDRIDNDKGHNQTNYHLSCLHCNLQKRRRTDDKFLFTKQLHLIKEES